MSDLKHYQDVIRLPRVTERGTSDQEKNNAYHFIVASTANKVQIRQAVEKLFNVKVLSVNTMLRKGKAKKRFTRRGQESWTGSNWKKAIVRLKAGDAINFQ